MFTRILVPLDGTAEAAVALPPAQVLARLTGAQMVLVGVVDARGALPDSPEAAAVHQGLERVADELRGAGTSVVAVARVGKAASELLEVRAEQQADLVVMATHGRSGLARAMLGSVAAHIVAESPVPVLLVRPGGERLSEIRTILVPVDGTPGAALALSAAVELARAAEARLVLLDVVVPIHLSLLQLPGFVDVRAPTDLAWDEDAHTGAHQYVERLADRLRKAGVSAEPQVAVDEHVGQRIVQTADEVGADLVVMSTHALTGPARALLGSVADEVVRNARRPVLVLHAARQGDASAAGTSS